MTFEEEEEEPTYEQWEIDYLEKVHHIDRSTLKKAKEILPVAATGANAAAQNQKENAWKLRKARANNEMAGKLKFSLLFQSIPFQNL